MQQIINQLFKNYYQHFIEWGMEFLKKKLKVHFKTEIISTVNNHS